MYVAMFAQSIPGLDVSMNLMLPQNTVICASGGGDESVELQKILAADALVPKTLMAAMNVFALVAVKCDCYEGCRQRLEMEKRLGVEESQFMSMISTAHGWGLSWEYLDGCSSYLRGHAVSLWKEWVLLVKLKHELNDVASEKVAVMAVDHAGSSVADTLSTGIASLLEQENMSAQGVSSSSAQGSTLEKFMELFVLATPGGIEGVMRKPGSVGLSVLLQGGGIQNDVEHVQEAISNLGWGEDHDYVYKDFRDLGVMLGCVDSDKGERKEQEGAYVEFDQAKAKRQQEAKELCNFLDCIEEASKQQDAEEVSCILDLVRQEEYAEIHSFVQWHKADVFKHDPLEAQANLKVEEAKWVRDNYCRYVRKFYIKKFVEDGIVLHRFEGT